MGCLTELEYADDLYVRKKAYLLGTFHYFSAANQKLFKMLVATCSSWKCMLQFSEATRM